MNRISLRDQYEQRVTDLIQKVSDERIYNVLEEGMAEEILQELTNIRYYIQSTESPEE